MSVMYDDSRRKAIVSYVNILNTLGGAKKPIENDFMVYDAPSDAIQQQGRVMVFRTNTAPFVGPKSTCNWWVFMVDSVPYLINRMVCLSLLKDSVTRIDIRCMYKVLLLTDDETSDDDKKRDMDRLQALYNETKTERDRVVIENESLRTENTTIKEELKRTHDEMIAVHGAVVKNNETRICGGCGTTKPIESFTDSCKKKSKSGETKTYKSIRSVCHKCRWASRKKAKTSK